LVVSVLKYRTLALFKELWGVFFLLFKVCETKFLPVCLGENSDYLMILPATFTQMINLKQKNNPRIGIRGERGGKY